MSEWDAFPAVGSAPKQDRGTRNRNPGNLKASPWSQRQPGYVGQDSGGFAMFDTPESGEAAQVNLLRSNYAGMSPTQVVNKYAPVGPENSQESVTNYINYASRRAGVDPNQPIPDELMADFARGMREFETGQTVNIPDEDFSEFEAFDEFPADDGEIVEEFSEEIATPGSSRENPIDVTDYNQVIQAKKGDWVRLENGDLTRAAGSAVEGQTGEQRAPGIFTRTTNLVDAIGAGATAAAEQIPFLDESVAYTTGLATGEGYQAMRDRQAALKQLDNEQNRGARVAGGVAGFGTGLLAPGGALINRGGTLASRSARSLGVGAGYGALYGAGSAEGNALERAPEALAGGVIGGITGGAAPALAQGASSFASNFLARPLGRATNFLSGGRLARGYAPEAQAERRLAVALRNDGVAPLQIRSIIDEFQSTGVTPTLLDVAQRAAPGGEAARLMRGAAMQQGPASVAAERHLERTAGGLQDRALNLTRGLTPNEPRAPQAYIDSLRDTRSRLATEQYAAPYASRVTPGAEVADALSGDPGLAAMRRARSAAVARRDEPQINDIDQLMATAQAVSQNPALAGRVPMPEVSAGTLDRIQRALGGRARKMEMSPDTRDIASGLYGRQSAVNQFLDDVPGLQEARDVYRGLTQQMDAAELGQRGLSAAPDTFSFTDATRPAAGVGYRGALESAIGAPKEGAVGALNRIGTSSNQTRNLREVFGPEADRYQAGIRNLVDQMKNAQFLASSSGSQTAPRAADTILAGIASLPTSVKTGFIGLIEKAARGATLTRAERQAIVELGVSEAQMREFATMPFLSGYLTVPAAQLEGQLVGRQGGR